MTPDPRPDDAPGDPDAPSPERAPGPGAGPVPRDQVPESGPGGAEGPDGSGGSEDPADHDGPPGTVPEEWTLLLKDLAFALAVVAGLVLAVFALTGTWPPVVVVESGSMMHDGTAFGRVGTIDPGDLVFVVAVDDPGDVTPAALARLDDGPSRYGAFGDVIIFRTGGGTAVIHRAMAWVDVTVAEDGEPRYTVEGYGVRDARSITIPELGLSDYRPDRAGFLTQGDANRAADQAAGIGGTTQPIGVADVLGRAQGEVPWFGLIKLMVAGNACQGDWVRLAGACAPVDLWAMFGVGLVALLSVPLAVDYAVVRMEGQEVVLEEIGDGPSGQDLSGEEPSDRRGKAP